MFARYINLSIVSLFVVLAAPAGSEAETCTMYEKYVKDHGSGDLCTTTAGTAYADHTPTGGAGILHAYKVPYCPATGLDTGCTDDEMARSLDGTRGFYHLDVGSDRTKWVFLLEGGGACGNIQGDSAATTCMDGSRTALDPDGVVNDELFSGYNDALADSREMTSKHARGNANTDFIEHLVPGNGILSDNNLNPFSTSTRVKLAKTTFDRFMGNRTLTETYNGDQLKMYFHGRRLLQAMFTDLNRAKCPQIEPNPECLLPDLSMATQIIVAGYSGGAGGLIHNMEWINNMLVDIAPSARIIFVVASRMIPFLEAEAHFAIPSYSLYSDHYSGVSMMVSNPNVTGPPRGPITAELTYSQAAFQANGSVRALLSTWGDPNSSTDPFLDQSCKTAHGNFDWRCFDEGHVALYHMDEDVFFYQSLRDTVHTNSSPLQWADTVRLDPANGPIGSSFSVAPWGGWLFRTPNGDSYSMNKSERVVYMAQEMWDKHPGAGSLAFYVPEFNCHTSIVRSAFWADTMISILHGEHNFGSYLKYWIDNYINVGNPLNLGTVQDNNTVEKFSGDGVVSASATCPQ